MAGGQGVERRGSGPARRTARRGASVDVADAPAGLESACVVTREVAQNTRIKLDVAASIGPVGDASDNTVAEAVSTSFAPPGTVAIRLKRCGHESLLRVEFMVGLVEFMVGLVGCGGRG